MVEQNTVNICVRCSSHLKGGQTNLTRIEYYVFLFCYFILYYLINLMVK